MPGPGLATYVRVEQVGHSCDHRVGGRADGRGYGMAKLRKEVVGAGDPQQAVHHLGAGIPHGSGRGTQQSKQLGHTGVVAVKQLSKAFCRQQRVQEAV